MASFTPEQLDELAKHHGETTSVDNKPPINTDTQVLEPTGQPAPLPQAAAHPPGLTPEQLDKMEQGEGKPANTNPMTKEALNELIQGFGRAGQGALGAVQSFGQGLPGSKKAMAYLDHLIHGNALPYERALKQREQVEQEHPIAKVLGTGVALAPLAAAAPAGVAGQMGMGGLTAAASHLLESGEPGEERAQGAIKAGLAGGLTAGALGGLSAGARAVYNKLASQGGKELADIWAARILGRNPAAMARTAEFGTPGTYSKAVTEMGLEQPLTAQGRKAAAVAQVKGPLGRQLDAAELGRNVPSEIVKAATTTGSPRVDEEMLGNMRALNLDPDKLAGMPVTSSNVRELLTKARQFTHNLADDPAASSLQKAAASEAKDRLQDAAELGLSPQAKQAYRDTLTKYAIASEARGSAARGMAAAPVSTFAHGNAEVMAGRHTLGWPGAVAAKLGHPYARNMLNQYKKAQGGTGLNNLADKLRKVAPVAAGAIGTAMSGGEPVSGAAELYKEQSSNAEAREAVSPHEGE